MIWDRLIDNFPDFDCSISLERCRVRAARVVLLLAADIEGYATKQAANVGCNRTTLAALELSVFLRDHYCKITPFVQLHSPGLVHLIVCNAAAVASHRQTYQNRVSFCLVAPALHFLQLCCSSDGTSPTREIVNQSVPNRARLPPLACNDSSSASCSFAHIDVACCALTTSADSCEQGKHAEYTGPSQVRRLAPEFNSCVGSAC